MNDHNAQFVARPDLYILRWAVNSVMGLHAQHNRNIGGQMNAMAALGHGNFDLVPQQGADMVHFKVANGPVVGDAAITGYWCPFIQGNVLPGHVDIPLINPAYRFVFTAAMNGCAFVTTTLPGGEHIRVYHHQHPDHMRVWEHIRGEGHPVRSTFNYDEYAGAGGAVGAGVANGFCFLWYRNGGWRYLAQPQILLPNLEVSLNPGVQVQISDV